ncbi:Uncharacterized protein PBTT_06195 [Plasmodiophora brassicae]|uniref:Uncharacterized protein n=1 Tax=Plasmodiophora brassicae TaxID=37360 RepID=A0A3P3YEF9_PLABS|nr:unnamed protein product [Plasmodiophora brassicae]
MADVSHRMLVLSGALVVSLSACLGSGHDTTLEMLVLIAPTLADSELLELSGCGSDVGNAASKILDARYQWRSLFKPGTTADHVRQFFVNEHVFYQQVNDRWAGTQTVSLRDQIMFLDRLAGDVDVELDEFVSRWERAVFQWKLPGGLALGTLIRHCAGAIRDHDDDLHFQFLTALESLLRRGAAFSVRGYTGREAADFLPFAAPEYVAALEISPVIGSLRMHDVGDDDIVAVQRIIDGTEGHMSRYDNWNEHNLMVAVEHGWDVNGKHPLLIGLTWFDLFITKAQKRSSGDALHAILNGIDFGLDVERIVAERTEKLVREDDADGETLEWQFEKLLDKILPLAADPTETFVNLWGKYYHTLTAPNRFIDHIVVCSQQIAQTPLFVSSWAHDIAVRLLRLQMPVSCLDHIVRLIEPGTPLISGVGSTILRDYDLCDHRHPLSDLHAFAGTAHISIVRTALQSADPVTKRTILHQHCMSIAVLEWIQDRADPQWFLSTLLSRTPPCLDYWLFTKSGSLRYDNDVLGLIHSFRAATGLKSTPLHVIVANHCSSRSQTYLHTSKRVMRHLYTLHGPAINAVDELTQVWVDDHLSLPGLAFALLCRLVMAPQFTEPYRLISTRIFAANNGAYLLELCEVHQWTPLHFAVAIPSLHAYVLDILEAARQTGNLDTVLFATDNVGRTFLHVAAERWTDCQAHPDYNGAAKAFKYVIRVIVQHLVRLAAAPVNVFGLITGRDAVDGTGWSVLQRIRVALDADRRETKHPDYDTAFLQELVQTVFRITHSSGGTW